MLRSRGDAGRRKKARTCRRPSNMRRNQKIYVAVSMWMIVRKRKSSVTHTHSHDTSVVKTPPIIGPKLLKLVSFCSIALYILIDLHKACGPRRSPHSKRNVPLMRIIERERQDGLRRRNSSGSTNSFDEQSTPNILFLFSGERREVP